MSCFIAKAGKIEAARYLPPEQSDEVIQLCIDSALNWWGSGGERMKVQSDHYGIFTLNKGDWLVVLHGDCPVVIQDHVFNAVFAYDAAATNRLAEKRNPNPQLF